MSDVGLYAKAFVGAAVAGLMTALTAVEDGSVTVAEWLLIAGAVLASLAGVAVIRNARTGAMRYAKAILGGLVGLVAALSTAFTDGGLSSVELILAVLAALGGSGMVAITPNAMVSDQFRTGEVPAH